MKIHELLKEPTSWTRYADARDYDGATVEVDSEEACRWCLLGAIRRCYPNAHERAIVAHKVAEKVAKLGNYRQDAPEEECSTDIWLWNDRSDTEYKDVVALAKELDI